MRTWIHAHRRALVALLIVTAIGGALRGVAAANRPDSQSADESAYARLANSIVYGHTYAPKEMRDPVRWGPGGPALFAATLWLQPERGVDGDVPTAYWAQVVVGTLTIPAVFLLTVLLAGPAAGLLAAALVAGYPSLIVAAGDLLTESLGAFVLVLALTAFVLTVRRRSIPWALATGVLLGVLELVRVDMILFPLLIVGLCLAALWRPAGRRRAATLAATTLVGVLATLAPWVIYASELADEFVPVTSGGSSNLVIGLYGPGDGRLYGLKRGWADEVYAHHPGFRGVPYQRLEQQFVMQAIARRYPGMDSEAALRRYALHEFRIYVLGDPLDFARISAQKGWRLWAYPWRGSGYWYLAADRVKVGYHVPLVLLGFVGMLAGMVLTRWRDAGLWALTLALAYVTALNMLLVSESRHNLPFMPALVVGGVVGLSLLLARLHARRADDAAPDPPSSARQPHDESRPEPDADAAASGTTVGVAT